MKRCRSSDLQLSVVGEETLKRCRSSSHETVNSHNFLTLPVVIKHKILSLVEITDLINMWDASKELQLMVKAYCAGSHCPQFSQFYDPHNHPQHSFRRFADLYKAIGSLFRRTCQNLSFRRKLQFLEFHLPRHIPSSSHSLSSSPNSSGQGRYLSVCSVGSIRCPAPHLYGILLKEYTYDWPEHDIQRAFHTLVHVCFSANFWFRLSCIVSQRPGVDPQSELTVRLFLRKIFLDPLSLPQEYSSTSTTSSSPASVSYENHHLVSDTNSVTNEYDLTQNSQESQNLSEASNSHFDGTSDQLVLLKNLPVETTSSYLSSSYTGDDSLAVGVIEPAELLCVATGSTSPSSAPTTVQPSSCYYGIPMPNNSWPASKNLMRILRSFSHNHQARILFILYGPTNRGNLYYLLLFSALYAYY
ncbi:unnamed protein product [Heterobilharzia americana]|nr:unnamed protein product [Heterobilharzia americana]